MPSSWFVLETRCLLPSVHWNSLFPAEVFLVLTGSQDHPVLHVVSQPTASFRPQPGWTQGGVSTDGGSTLLSPIPAPEILPMAGRGLMLRSSLVQRELQRVHVLRGLSRITCGQPVFPARGLV